MSRDIQQDSDSVSPPPRGQSHSETNQISSKNKQKRQLKSVRFVKDNPESCQDPDPKVGPASANNVNESQRNDSVPHLEASNWTTGLMTPGNIQETRDSDDEPDACIPGTYGSDPVPSVSEDYVPWFEMDAASFKGIIPEIAKSLSFLLMPFFMLAFLTTVFQMVASGSDLELHIFRWGTLFAIGAILDFLLSYLFVLALAFHSDVSRLKAGFGKGVRGLVSLIARSFLTILICVAMLVFVYYASSTHSALFMGWYTGPLPQSFRGCEARVGPTQSSLFTEPIYAGQFARIQRANFSNDYEEFLEFDMQAFDAIRHDQILCGQGFIGNSDLYGLGSRVSLYLQWLSALLVNNFVPRIRHEFRKMYLVFSMGLCVATFVFTFSTACTFAVEIEILYWAYWGGFLCVFATSPSYTRLGSEVKWIGLDWITGINYLIHILMFYHSTFFWHYGYDQIFSRMPCGTYHFVFAPLLDPSQSFWFFRDTVTMIINPVNIAFILIIPIAGLSLMSEIKESICDSSVNQNLGIYLMGSGRSNPETVRVVDSTQASLSTWSRSISRALGFFGARLHRHLRELCSLPSHSRGGIRLLTPVDIKQRKRYRIRCALSGLASCTVSFAAIEATLHSNKVVGISSIVSTGQYLAFVIGVSTLIIALWQLLKQEAVRRRDLSRRHILNEDTENIELETLPHTVWGAVRYTFGQVDTAFMTNGGVFEASSGTMAEESESISEQASTHSADPEDLYIMSGALQRHEEDNGQ